VRRNRARDALRGGAMILAQVRRVYTGGDDLPYMDVEDRSTGRFWEAVPIACHGGAPGNLAYFPPHDDPDGRSGVPGVSPDATVLLAFRTGDSMSPICLGVLPHQQTGFSAAGPTPGQTEDHDGSFGAQDVVIKRGGTTVIVDGRGGVLIDVGGADADATCRIQLGASGLLRVSRSGAAGDRAALAGPVTSKIDEVIDKLADLQLGIEMVWPIAFPQTKYQPAVLPPTKPGDSLKSAAVHLAVDSE